MKKNLLAMAIFTASTVSQGQTIFQKTYGGSSSTPEYSYSVQQTSDNGYAAVGYTTNFGAVGQDIYLIKTDVNGDTIWSKTYGGTNDDIGYSVKQTTDGGFIITGVMNQFGGIGGNLCLIKTKSNGDTSWVKTFGVGYDEGRDVEQTTDGGFIIVGYIAFNSLDIYLIRTDVNGDTLWTKAFSGGNGNDYGYSVQQTTDGGFVLTGNMWLNSSYAADVFLTKFDAIGNLLWSKTFGGTNFDSGRSVHQTNDGGFIITGETGSFGAGGIRDIYLIKTDASGNLSWTKTFGTAVGDYGYSAQETNDGGFIVTGRLDNSNNGTYLIKTDNNGDSLWSKLFEGAGGRSAEQTVDGGYIITGGGGANNKIILIKTDSNGNSCNQYVPSVIATTPGTLTGSPSIQLITDTIIIDRPVLQIHSGGIMTTLCLTGVNELIPDHLFHIFPNPFCTQTTLQTVERLQNASLTVYNSFGQAVKQLDNLSGQTIIFHRENLPSGLYFVRLIQDNKLLATDKLVVTD